MGAKLRRRVVARGFACRNAAHGYCPGRSIFTFTYFAYFDCICDHAVFARRSDSPRGRCSVSTHSHPRQRAEQTLWATYDLTPRARQSRNPRCRKGPLQSRRMDAQGPQLSTDAAMMRRRRVEALRAFRLWQRRLAAVRQPLATRPQVLRHSSHVLHPLLRQHSTKRALRPQIAGKRATSALSQDPASRARRRPRVLSIHLSAISPRHCLRKLIEGVLAGPEEPMMPQARHHARLLVRNLS